MNESKSTEYALVALIAVVVIGLGALQINILDSLTAQYPVLESAGITACDKSGAEQCHLAVAQWGDATVGWLDETFGYLFGSIRYVIDGSLQSFPSEFEERYEEHFTWWPGILTIFETALTSERTPAYAVLLSIAVLGYLAGGWRTGGFVLGALLFITAMGFFEPTMVTLSLVLTATLLALIIGIPIGIAKAHSRALTLIIDPVLDFMQTMPLFVYLIPAVLFFSIGDVPGIVATFIFATPPAVRLTALGIEQIPEEFIEAGRAFGATPFQTLRKIEIPIALPSIMAGVNQTIMLALSMVVVASMVGASGLGRVVYTSITQLKAGQGIASGIGIVLLAMVLDRLTRAASKRTSSQRS